MLSPLSKRKHPNASPSGNSLFSETSPPQVKVRFCTGYVEVSTEDFEPHLNHASCNSLIINEFIILHLEVILALETEISSPATYGIVRVGAIVECKYGVVATLAKQCSAKATNC